jgi:hypothetical protein
LETEEQRGALALRCFGGCDRSRALAFTSGCRWAEATSSGGPSRSPRSSSRTSSRSKPVTTDAAALAPPLLALLVVLAGARTG